MKIKFLIAAFFICTIAFAQTKGTVAGVLTDKDANNATLPFANAAIKGTTVGTTTDEIVAEDNKVCAVKVTTDGEQHTIAIDGVFVFVDLIQTLNFCSLLQSS